MKTDKVECEKDERKQKIIYCDFSGFEKVTVYVRRKRNCGWTRNFPPNGLSTKRAHTASSDNHKYIWQSSDLPSIALAKEACLVHHYKPHQTGSLETPSRSCATVRPTHDACQWSGKARERNKSCTPLAFLTGGLLISIRPCLWT